VIWAWPLASPACRSAAALHRVARSRCHLRRWQTLRLAGRPVCPVCRALTLVSLRLTSTWGLTRRSWRVIWAWPLASPACRSAAALHRVARSRCCRRISSRLAIASLLQRPPSWSSRCATSRSSQSMRPTSRATSASLPAWRASRLARSPLASGLLRCCRRISSRTAMASGQTATLRWWSRCETCRSLGSMQPTCSETSAWQQA